MSNHLAEGGVTNPVCDERWIAFDIARHRMFRTWVDWLATNPDRAKVADEITFTDDVLRRLHALGAPT